MDPGETVVEASSSHEYPGEESRRSHYHEGFDITNYFGHRDDHSDIYFDKSVPNFDEASL